MTYRIDAAGRIDSAATDHGTATITAEGHINLKSSDAENCCGISILHPRARMRVKSAANIGPPSTMQTVLMF